MKSTVTFTFDRIGRAENPEPIVVEVTHPDDPENFVDVAARKLFTAVRPRVTSRDMEVWVDLEKMAAGILVGGMRSAGTATVTVVPA